METGAVPSIAEQRGGRKWSVAEVIGMTGSLPTALVVLAFGSKE